MVDWRRACWRQDGLRNKEKRVRRRMTHQTTCEQQVKGVLAQQRVQAELERSLGIVALCKEDVGEYSEGVNLRVFASGVAQEVQKSLCCGETILEGGIVAATALQSVFEDRKYKYLGLGIAKSTHAVSAELHASTSCPK